MERSEGKAKSCKHPRTVLAEEVRVSLYFEFDGAVVEDGSASNADPTGMYSVTCQDCAASVRFGLMRARRRRLPAWAQLTWDAVEGARASDELRSWRA